MVNPLQAAAGLALVFLLPGFFLVKALWPRERLSRDFHGPLVLFLSVSMSVVITIIVGSVLGFAPVPEGAEKGWFQGAATGAPYIELSLLAVTLVLAAVAGARGAFPRIYAGRARDAAGAPRAKRRERLADSAVADAVAARARGDDAAAEDVERDLSERQYGPRPE